MNGAEHYRAAEAHLNDVPRLDPDDYETPDQYFKGVANHLAAAQVHATLAQAAATAALIPERDSLGNDNSSIINTWFRGGAFADTKTDPS